MSALRTVTVPRGDFNKFVEAGDLVLLNGRCRMITHVSRSMISFVRFRSSWCWKKGKRNATVFYDLPMQLTIIQHATAATRLLAKRFESWLQKSVSSTDWKQVCDLSVAAIRCTCE